MAAALTGFGGRDQLQVAAMQQALGPSRFLTATALAASVATCLLAGWAGGAVESLLSDSAETMLVAIAFGMVALELAWLRVPRRAREPTRSLGAVAIVLLARQIGDGPRLAVFALAAASGAPVSSALGGAAGSTLGMAAALALGHRRLEAMPLKAMRRGLAVLVAIVAATIAMIARGNGL